MELFQERKSGMNKPHAPVVMPLAEAAREGFAAGASGMSRRFNPYYRPRQAAGAAAVAWWSGWDDAAGCRAINAAESADREEQRSHG